MELTVQQATQGQISIESQSIINNITAFTAPKMGQPTIINDELIEQICERVMAGESVTQICHDPSMPARSTIQRWKREYPEVKARIEEAYEYWADVIDDVNEDILRGGIMSTGNLVRDIELVKYSKWRMSKRNRTQFGDTLDVKHSTETININLPGEFGDDFKI